MNKKQILCSLLFVGALGGFSLSAAANGMEAYSVSSMKTTATPPVSGMTPEILLTLPRVGGYALSPDGKTIVYTVSHPNLKENNSKTYIYSIGVDGKNKKMLSQEGTSDYAPIWYKGGREIAFLSAFQEGLQVFLMNTDGSNRRAITQIKGGVNEFKFSPNEQELLYVQDIKFGQTTQDRYPDLDKASGFIVEDLMYKHWDEWVRTIPHPFLAPVSSLPITQGTDLLQGEPYEAPMKPHSDLSDFSFSPDGRYIAYACRKKTGLEYSLSTNSDIYLYDRETGKTENVSSMRKGYDTTPVFSPDGQQLAWVSMERDGYESDLKELIIMNLSDRKIRMMTSTGFEYNVESPTWATDGKSIYFVACKEGETNIFNINVKTGKIRSITQGQHDYTGFVLQNGIMVGARQSMTYPTELYKVDLKKGKETAVTTEAYAALGSLEAPRCEARWMPTTNGEKMLVWVLYPPHFDSSKKYPSILYCQGGPQNTISQFWSYRWNPRLMAEQGYVVILPNRHGVPGFGKAWNEQISGDYGGQNMKDYMQAADLMKQEPFIDAERMGCVGASYGGFSVYWLAGHHQKRFAAFIAHAGIFNLETQYLETEEKWFANWDMGGAPWEKDNAIAQRTFATSPHKFVENWDTPILIIHGERDYRILASQGMMAFDAAKMRGIPTEMLLYPDENHWVLQPQNALLWQRTFFGWLDKWLKK